MGVREGGGKWGYEGGQVGTEREARKETTKMSLRFSKNPLFSHSKECRFLQCTINYYQLCPAVTSTNNLSLSEKGLWRSLTCRCGIAHREGGQCGVQAIDSIVEMLGKEDVALHRLTGQSMQLLPPGKQKQVFRDCTANKKEVVSSIIIDNDHYFPTIKHTWGSEGPRRTRPRLSP